MHTKLLERIFLLETSTVREITFVCILLLVILLIITIISQLKNKKVIKAQRIANENMRDGFEKYKTLFNSMQVSIEYYGADGYIIDFNDKCLEMWGIIDKETVIAQGQCIFLNPYLTDDEKERVRRGEVVSFVRIHNFDYINEIGLFKTKREGEAAMSISISPIKNSQDKLIGYVIITVDTTEKYKYEKELEASRLKWENLYNEKSEMINSMPIGLSLYDKEGKLQTTNQAMIDIFESSNVDKEEYISLFNNPDIPEPYLTQIKNREDIDTTIVYDLGKITQESDYNSSMSRTQLNIDAKFRVIRDTNNDVTGYMVIIQDVTEKVKQENNLKEANKRNDLVLDNINTGLIYLSDNYIVQWTNLDKFKNIADKISKIDSVKDITCHKAVHGKDTPCASCIMKQAIESGIPVNKELVYKNLIIDITAIPVCNEKGKAIGVLLKLDDVTEQRKLVKNLELLHNKAEYSLSLLNNIIEKIPLSIFIKDIDDDFRYIVVNQNLVALQGKTKEEVIGRNDYELFDSDTADIFRAEDVETVSLGFPITRIKSLNLNGTNSIQETTEVGFATEDGRHLIVGIVKDMTERENARIELQQAKDAADEANVLLNNIIQQIPTGLYIKDIDDDFRYLIVNQKLADMHNCRVDDFIGKTICNIIDKERVNIFIKDNQDTIEKNGEINISIKHIEINGIMRVHEVAQMMFSAAKGHRLIIGIVSDITDKEKQQRELEQAKERAEESDKLKSAFLANMSHEIRTPLNAIVGFSELIKDSENEQEKEDYFKIISTNNELLLRLIGDILDLSKIESGILHFDRQRFDMVTFFNEFSASMRLKSTNQNVEFISINPYKSCIVELDKNRLAQVLTNFVNNAIKFTLEGYIKIGYEYIDKGLRLYVEDSGIGISEEKKSRIFQRFEKLDDFAQGTGLGLSICKAIIETNGGKVGYESTKGVGSTFWSWSPIEVQIIEYGESSSPEIKIQPTLPIGKIVKEKDVRILIAEDNESNYLLIKSILKEYDLTRVVNGLEAVEILKKEHFNIVLMDMKMPIMGGIEATKKIREFNSDILIIAVTANVFDSDKDNAINAGCNAFIPKPIRREELLREIWKDQIE